MVTAADLVRASEHLQVLRALTATTAADTVAVARDVTRLGEATDWWLGPHGDDLRAGLAQLAGDARSAVAPLESLATTVQGLQTTAAALAAELFVLERQRNAAQDGLSRLWRAARSVVEDTFGVDAGVAEEEAALARIEAAIAEAERRWTLACRTAASTLEPALAAVAAGHRRPAPSASEASPSRPALPSTSSWACSRGRRLPMPTPQRSQNGGTRCRGTSAPGGWTLRRR